VNTVLVIVNGDDTELPADSSVDSLVDRLATDRRRIAVARNGEVVPRSVWAQTPLADGDRVEILAAVAGG
jgi:sulfur carrier protein